MSDRGRERHTTGSVDLLAVKVAAADLAQKCAHAGVFDVEKKLWEAVQLAEQRLDLDDSERIRRDPPSAGNP